MTKYKEEVALVTSWDGKAVQKGVADTKKEVSGLTDSLKTAGAVMAGTLASAAIVKGIELTKRAVAELGREFGRTIDAAGQAQQAQARMAAAITAQGKSYGDVKTQLNAVTDAMYRYAGVSRNEVSDAFSRMLVLTGDVEKSLRTLPAVYDMMAVSGQSVDAVTRMMSQAWEGSTSMLGRYIPALRGMSVESAKAGEFIQKLAVIQGQATNQTNTYTGSVETLKGQVNDLRTVLGTPIINALTPGISKLADTLKAAIERGDFDETARLLGSITTNLMVAADALWGRSGLKGAIDGIDAFLTRLDNYTSRPDFTNDLQAIGAALSQIADVTRFLLQHGDKLIVLLSTLKGGGMGTAVMPGWGTVAGAAAGFGASSAAMGWWDEGKAAGGLIPGTAHRPGDNMFLPVRSGEYVVNENATRMFLPFLEELNKRYGAGSTAGSGTGLASGGFADKFRQKYMASAQGFGGLQPAALENILRIIADWMGLNRDEVQITPNYEFIRIKHGVTQLRLLSDVTANGYMRMEDYYNWLVANDFTDVGEFELWLDDLKNNPITNLDAETMQIINGLEEEEENGDSE